MAAITDLLPARYSGPQPIGRGGMGEIFRATDTSLGRAVAIKVLDQRYAQDEGVRERFTREALAVARLSGNPSIVTIYDVGEWRERPFIVMEYLAGGSLQERIDRQGAQPTGVVLRWLEQAAYALDTAHREGVIHRDVKPANLLLDRHDRVHVADFGIASAAGLNSLTQTGTVLGTASYLSPEQAQGARATPASDLYSLGVVAFELLAGRRPFEGDSMAAEAAAHVTGQIPSVCDVNPELPCELDPVFAKALAKDPSKRYSSCAEFVAALRASLEDAAGATGVLAAAPPPRPAGPTRPTTPRPTTPVYGARRRPAWLLPAIGVLLLAAGGVALAVALTRGGHAKASPSPQKVTVVHTITQPGTTVVSTAQAATPPPTTAAPPPTTQPTTTQTSTEAASGDPVALNNQAYELMKQGDYTHALPLLESAVSQMQGSGSLANAYANYNLGVTLMQLGRCADAMPYLETSKSLQPGRKEVLDAIKQARTCSG